MDGKNPTIGLFLCRCGKNIADFIDLDELRQWGVKKSTFVESHDLLCSPAGKQFLAEKLQQHEVDALIIAACSPKMHEQTFRDIGQKSGKNLAKIHMANIREQCGWVTNNKNDATKKAKNLINAAIKRIALHENLEQQYMECLTDIVVIGGGIAGMEAALMAANAGRKVTIIERNISLGGTIIKTEEVAPNMECAPCLLAPRLAAIKDHPNIMVISNAEITDVLGFFGNFTVKARKKARFVNDTCIGCEACFDACPVSVSSDFHLHLGTRKAIYNAFPGSVPAAAAIDQKNCKHFIDNSCDACVTSCPFQSIDFADQDEELEFPCGAVIVATGYDSPHPGLLKPLGYGTLENVYTMPEFERLASSNGPHTGTIQLKNGKTPESVAVVHCAGSLSSDGIPYCSGICCMTATKVGELMRKQNPQVKVYNVHDRLVFPSPESHTFYQHQNEQGTVFHRTNDLESLTITKSKEKLIIATKDVNLPPVDIVILATGLVPAKGTKKLAEMLNVELDKYGFYQAGNAILNATGSTLDGINIAGCCASPCDAATAITRAQSAVGDALSKLIPGNKIALEVMTTVINEELCAGCKLCVSVCPYKAISYTPDKKVSMVHEAICRGCGTCAASCPGGAAKAKHFTDKQIYAEIGGILHG